MNDAMSTAAATADLGWVAGVMTAVFLVTFVVWTWYAYAPSQRKHMEEASRLPFDGGES